MTETEYILRVLRCFALWTPYKQPDGFDMEGDREALAWRTDAEYLARLTCTFNGAPPSIGFIVVCSQDFPDGHSDAEPITPDSLPTLEGAAADLAAAGGDFRTGMLYAARMRQRVPSEQRMAQIDNPAVRALFEAAATWAAPVCAPPFASPPDLEQACRLLAALLETP